MVRKYVPTLLLVVLTSLITSAAPTFANTVADLAKNASMVDGIRAVHAITRLDQRQDMRLATLQTTGLLPNNIIAKAPDAEHLDGLASASFYRTTDTVANANHAKSADSAANATHATSADSATNSDRLDGYHANGLSRVGMAASEDLNGIYATSVLAVATLTVPSYGFVLGPVGTVLYLLLMVAVVIGVNYGFVRRDFGRRLAANILIVAAFLLFYVVFLR